jgi:hypothetical protein
MKSYTDLSQSKKLAEFLPLKSADMFYNPRPSNEIPYVGNANTVLLQVPCWSLAALFSIIPKQINIIHVLQTDIGEDYFSIWYDELCYGGHTKLPDITMENPVDACYEMIIKLHELKLI